MVGDRLAPTGRMPNEPRELEDGSERVDELFPPNVNKASDGVR